MSDLFSRAFWTGCAERAVKTFAQSAVGLALAAMRAQSAPAGQELLDAGRALTGSTLLSILYAALIPTVLSVLTSVSNPSFVAGSESHVEKAAAAAEKSLTVQNIAGLTAAALAEKATGAADTPAQDRVAAEKATAAAGTSASDQATAAAGQATAATEGEGAPAVRDASESGDAAAAEPGSVPAV